jgi:hypothetical protein
MTPHAQPSPEAVRATLALLGVAVPPEDVDAVAAAVARFTEAGAELLARPVTGVDHAATFDPRWHG